MKSSKLITRLSLCPCLWIHLLKSPWLNPFRQGPKLWTLYVHLGHFWNTSCGLMIPDQVYDEHSAYKGNHLQVKNFVFVVTICHQQCFQCLHACPCVPGGQIRTTWKLTTVLKKKSVLRFRTPKMLHQKHANIKQKNPYSTWYLASATPTLWKWVLLPRVGGKLTVGSWACTYDRVIMGLGIHLIYFCLYFKEISQLGILVFPSSHSFKILLLCSLVNPSSPQSPSHLWRTFK